MLRFLVVFLTLIHTIHCAHSLHSITMPEESSLMMKAVVASKFGSPDDVLSIQDMPRPSLDDSSSSSNNKKDKKPFLILQVHACSLSPGDYRALLGDKTVVCNPSTWPYIPGGDVCGTIQSVSPTAAAAYPDFKVGDKVVATWEMWGLGGLGQYTKVDPRRTVKLPEDVSVWEGAALANSASHALNMFRRAKIQEGERVLVLGGSGGLGTILVQLLKNAKCSYVAATSTDEALMKDLGVDQVVDYTKDNFYDIPEWQTNKFDCIMDCAVGVQAWKSCSKVLKSGPAGGRYVTAVFNEHYISGKRIHEIITLLLPPLGRQMFNGWWSSPTYRMYLGEPSQETMKEVMELLSSKKIRVVLDSESPHPYTTQGVRDAWNKHIARKGHGKIVITVD